MHADTKGKPFTTIHSTKFLNIYLWTQTGRRGSEGNGSLHRSLLRWTFYVYCLLFITLGYHGYSSLEGINRRGPNHGTRWQASSRRVRNRCLCTIFRKVHFVCCLVVNSDVVRCRWRHLCWNFCATTKAAMSKIWLFGASVLDRSETQSTNQNQTKANKQTQDGVSMTKRGLRSVQPYLELFVEELSTLYTTGIRVFDASRQTSFRLRVKLLFVAGDHPGLLLLCSVPPWAIGQCTMHGFMNATAQMACYRCLDQGVYTGGIARMVTIHNIT
jgi:hypothetical protein